MLVANNSDQAEFRDVSERLCSNIGTARMVAEIFRQQFFVPVRSREARLYGYQRNGKSLTEYLYYLMARRLMRKWYLYVGRGTVNPRDREAQIVAAAHRTPVNLPAGEA